MPKLKQNQVEYRRENYTSLRPKPVKKRCDYCGRPNLPPSAMCATNRTEPDGSKHPICLFCNNMIVEQGRRLKPIPEADE